MKNIFQLCFLFVLYCSLKSVEGSIRRVFRLREIPAVHQQDLFVFDLDGTLVKSDNGTLSLVEGPKTWEFMKNLPAHEIILTKRNNIEETFRQLEKSQLSFWQFLSPEDDCTSNGIFHKGILFCRTYPCDKGQILSEWLKGQKYRRVYFLDDLAENVFAVNSRLFETVEIHSYHYLPPLIM